MAQTCPKCSRVNPAEAVYCWFDGVALGAQASQTPVNIAAQRFLAPFVFPSGRACQSFDELSLAIQDDWSGALETLRDGDLAAFLAGIGRADLARAAREAAKAPDLERGLDDFLSRLPSKRLEGPKLYVEPIDINLGNLRPGEDRKFEVHLRNQGMRLLYGTLVSKDLWLTVGDAANTNQKLFQFQNDLVVPVHVHAKRLGASVKPMQARLIVDSNAGRVEVNVRASVPARPFPTGVLAGALTPRQLAEKAKESPRDAAAFFENGSVARWYRDNNWKYPVQGPTSSGLGAIQQYFEAHGLAKPPKVNINQKLVALHGKVGQQLQHELEVSTPEARAVYALARSSQPWLSVGCPTPRGRTASVCLVVQSVPDRPGETLKAKVLVVANGNQRFEVPVTLAVDTKAAPAAAAKPRRSGVQVDRVAVKPAPMMAAVAAPPPLSKPRKKRRYSELDEPDSRRPTNWVKHLLPAGIILLILMGLFARDTFVQSDAGIIEEEGPALLSTDPLISVRMHNQTDKKTVANLPNPTQRFGLVMLKEKDPRGGDRFKRLTYFERGQTNNTCIRVDGSDFLFGQGAGQWKLFEQALGNDSAGRKRDGYKSIWLVGKGNVSVTQIVEIVPGQTSRMLDTCLVRYTLENLDSKPRKVGLRFLLDTYIGANDGVPFTLPGSKELCNTSQAFKTAKEVPDFIQALELPDLSNPKTIATVQFRLGGKIEAPSRVLLGAWPNAELAKPRDDPRLRGEQTLWDVPLLSMRTAKPADSAVVMYWDERQLAPKQTRELGFTYGLGTVAGGEGGGKIGVTVGGSLAVDADFTITALVSRPAVGEAVTLMLPEGMTRVEGDATQLVPSLPANAQFSNSPITWKVRASKRGVFPIKVTSSTGASQSLKIRISQRNLFD